MFFGIVLTPKQFLAGFVMAGFLSFLFLIPMIFGTTPSWLDTFPERIAEITKDYDDANAELEKKTKLGESAVLNAQVSELKISKDVRLTVSEKYTIKNIFDKPVVGVTLQSRVHSNSMGNCIIKSDWVFRFDEPLLPSASKTFEREWQSLAMSHVVDEQRGQSPACDAFRINDLIGTHKISRVEAMIHSYTYIDLQKSTSELTYQIGPTHREQMRPFELKETLDYCTEVISLIDKGAFSEEDIDNYPVCFNKLGYYKQPGSIREKLAE